MAVNDTSKGKSPFYPGQPVPVELFVGRATQIERILQRGAGQVAQGKPMAFFVQGEYGIGKSSVANFTQWVAEREMRLLPIYVTLGGTESIEDVAAAILEGTVRSGALEPKRMARLGEWLAKYVGKQQLFGVSVNLEALKKEAPQLATPFGLLSFLRELHARLSEDGVQGIYLVLDEINGITANSAFAHFIKGIVDTNAIGEKPVPLFLVLCGVEEKRREMIQAHQPVDRIFDVVDIAPMTVQEAEEFFKKAFKSVQMTVNEDALATLTHYSAGFPKIMHLVGDAAFWLDKDGVVDSPDATSAVILAAGEVGKKYVDQQVYKALRSEDYRQILKKIGKISPLSMSFMKSEVTKGLTEPQKRKFNNFLQRMTRLKVIRHGDSMGEYVFNVRMVRLYIWLQSWEPANGKPESGEKKG